MSNKVERSSNRVKINVLFDEISSKVDREHGAGVYFKNMALFSGVGLVTSLGAVSQMTQNNNFAYIALATILTAGGVVFGFAKSLFDEKKQVNSVMTECIKDIATRDNLIPVEKVVLQRYLSQEKLNVKEVVKENIIKTDIDLSALSKMSTEDLKKKVKEEFSQYSQEQVQENIKYSPEYMREVKSELVARLERLSQFQKGLDTDPKPKKATI